MHVRSGNHRRRRMLCVRCRRRYVGTAQGARGGVHHLTTQRG